MVSKYLLPLLVASVTIRLSEAGSISDSLIAKFASGGKQDAILELPSVFSKAMNNPILSMLSGSAQAAMIPNVLKQMTSASQAPFMAMLTQMGVAESATPFWVTNDIGLKNANLPMLQALAAIPGTFTIREPEIVQINPAVHDMHVRQSDDDDDSQADDAQWGVKKIEAPAVWSKGFRGQNVIVANIDSGVNGDHEALKGNYGGKWLDATNEGDRTPKDRHGHGTHTMGTICGTTQGIGVAPGATWIACKGLNKQGSGQETWLKKCGQWLMEQKPIPKVINNSWGGGQGSKRYDDMIKAWTAAGIVGVFSIGNAGSRCQTANSPGDSDVAWSVGSTDSGDTISSFSSRGPSTSGKLKPEVSAPGGRIISASHSSNTGLTTMSGTSMASPHVSGAVALMLSQNPKLSVSDVIKKMQAQIDKPTVSRADQKCTKGSNGNTYPNNIFGNGRVNIKKAMGL